MKIKKFKILANQVNGASSGRDLYLKLAKLTDRFLDTQLGYLGFVPSDEYLKKSVKRQSSAIQLYPQSSYSKALKKLAAILHRRPPADVVSSGLGFFFERLITTRETG